MKRTAQSRRRSPGGCLKDFQSRRDGSIQPGGQAQTVIHFYRDVCSLRSSCARSSHRPNGPGDPSPGLRPKADTLGNKSDAHPGGLKGRENPVQEESSRGLLSNKLNLLLVVKTASPRPVLSGRTALSSLHPGHRPSASALGSVLSARWAGCKWRPESLSFRPERPTEYSLGRQPQVSENPQILKALEGRQQFSPQRSPFLERG